MKPGFVRRGSARTAGTFLISGDRGPTVWLSSRCEGMQPACECKKPTLKALLILMPSRRQAGRLTAINFRQAAAASAPEILREVRCKYVKSAALDDKAASHPGQFAPLGRATVVLSVATSFLSLRSSRKGYCFRAIPTYAFGS
jgi:hypothetical protein